MEVAVSAGEDQEWYAGDEIEARAGHRAFSAYKSRSILESTSATSRRSIPRKIEMKPTFILAAGPLPTFPLVSHEWECPVLPVMHISAMSNREVEDHVQAIMMVRPKMPSPLYIGVDPDLDMRNWIIVSDRTGTSRWRRVLDKHYADLDKTYDSIRKKCPGRGVCITSLIRELIPEPTITLLVHPLAHA